MDEKETLNFKIGLSGTSDKKQTEFKISINGNTLVHSKLTKPVNETEYFEFAHDISEGDNTLEISLLNKGFGDTVLGADGNIVNDMLLNIDSIEIDEIDLGSLKWTLSSYEPLYPERYRAEAKKRSEELSSSVKNCVNLGWNGTWKLPFTSPFYIWLLENI
jgi:hypothetical protein